MNLTMTQSRPSTVPSVTGRHTAPGKVILLGEHSVVYGHPALAGALTDGATVKITPGQGDLVIENWNVRLSPQTPCEHALGHAYRALRKTLGLPETSPVDLHVDFSIPTGAGLGSSAALAVAVIRALGAAHGRQFSYELAGEAAMASETVIHGKPSGLDHTVSLRGGFGLFTRQGGFTSLAEHKSIPLLIGQTGRQRDTKGRVARVAELFETDRATTEQHFHAIASGVTAGAEAIARSDWKALGEIMNSNQHHLEALDVSCPEIQAMVEIALGEGAYGAKLTGGGGGGSVIALAPGREARIAQAWQQAGFTSLLTAVGHRDGETRHE